MKENFFQKVKSEFCSKEECIEISKEWGQEKVFYSEETASNKVPIIILEIQWDLYSSWQNQVHNFLFNIYIYIYM